MKMTFLTCNKIQALLSMYIDHKLTADLEASVGLHLASCNRCQKKYKELKSMISSLRNSYKKIKEEVYTTNNCQAANINFKINEHERFKQNISAFLDEELNDVEMLEFKSYCKKMKSASDTIKPYIKLEELLKNNYTDLQKQTPKNFSKAVINEAILKEPYRFAAMFETVGIFLVFSIVCILFIGIYAFFIRF